LPAKLLIGSAGLSGFALLLDYLVSPGLVRSGDRTV
jgi:hypothetical protein